MGVAVLSATGEENSLIRQQFRYFFNTRHDFCQNGASCRWLAVHAGQRLATVAGCPDL